MGCEVVEVQTAREMLAMRLTGGLAVRMRRFLRRRWRIGSVEKCRGRRRSRRARAARRKLAFAENPDILATRCADEGKGRPKLVVGFAAETDDVLAHGAAKRKRKGCDWMVVNDVRPETGIMGGDENDVVLMTAAGPGGLAAVVKSGGGAPVGGPYCGGARDGAKIVSGSAPWVFWGGPGVSC